MHLAPQTTDPEDACEAVQPPSLDKPWIALVVRSRREHPSCTFDTKVRPPFEAGQRTCEESED